MKTSNSNTGIYHAYSVSDSGQETLLGSSENLVVDNGLNLINSMGSGEILHTCIVSSDTTQVNTGTNQVPSVVARTSNKVAAQYGSSDASPYYYWYRVTFEFATGEANGNLTKVAVVNAANSLFSVALFKDPEGDPTTIQPMAKERLRIVYEYRVYVNTEDIVIPDVKLFNDKETLYEITIRPANINASFGAKDLNKGLFMTDYYRTYKGNSILAYSGKIAAITGKPSVELFSKDDSFSSPPYIEGDFIRYFNVSFGYNEFNSSSGIQSFLFATSRGCFQVQIDPPLVKDNTQLMTIKFPITTGR